MFLLDKSIWYCKYGLYGRRPYGTGVAIPSMMFENTFPTVEPVNASSMGTIKNITKQQQISTAAITEMMTQILGRGRAPTGLLAVGAGSGGKASAIEHSQVRTEP
jgi:hypothetical protein